MKLDPKLWGIALVLTVATGFTSCCCEGSPTYEVRPPLASDGPSAPNEPPALRVLFFADFGEPTCQQAVVADAMARENQRASYDFAVVGGDNINYCGPDTELPGTRECRFMDGNAVDPAYQPPPDPRFAIAHELALAELRHPDGTPVPTYLALGNHDVSVRGRCAIPGQTAEETGRLRACLEVAHRSDQWLMPARHYYIDSDVARFIILDSNVIALPYGGFDLDAEIAFARDAVEGCAGRACFVVTHHPPVSAGDGGPPDASQRPAWEQLHDAVRGKVTAWLSGHDHDLQHLRLDEGPDVFVSGNTCRGNDDTGHAATPGATLLYGTTAWGFASIEVWNDGRWGLRFEGVHDSALHCCRATTALGACHPVRC